VDYVHLNPVRARLASTAAGLERYEWSSLRQIIQPPRQRPAWLAAGRLLAGAGPAGPARGPPGLPTRPGKIAQENPKTQSGLQPSPDGSLQRTLRRGWCFGSEMFREKLLKLAGSKVKGNANYRASPMGREHGERAAMALLKAALDHHQLEL